MPRIFPNTSSFVLQLTDFDLRKTIKKLKLPSDKEILFLSRFKYLSQFETERIREEREVEFKQEKNARFLDITFEYIEKLERKNDPHFYFLDLTNGEILKVDNTDGKRVAAKYYLGLSEISAMKVTYYHLNIEKPEFFNKTIKEIMESKIENDESLPLQKFIFGIQNFQDFQFVQKYFKKRTKVYPFRSDQFDHLFLKLIDENMKNMKNNNKNNINSLNNNINNNFNRNINNNNTHNITNSIKNNINNNNNREFLILKKRFGKLIQFEKERKSKLSNYQTFQFHSLTKTFLENQILHYGFEYFLDLNNLNVIKFDVLRKEEAGYYHFHLNKKSYCWGDCNAAHQINRVIGKSMQDLLATNNELWERDKILSISQILIQFHHSDNNNNNNNINNINNNINNNDDINKSDILNEFISDNNDYIINDHVLNNDDNNNNNDNNNVINYNHFSSNIANNINDFQNNNNYFTCQNNDFTKNYFDNNNNNNNNQINNDNYLINRVIDNNIKNEYHNYDNESSEDFDFLYEYAKNGNYDSNENENDKDII